VGNVAGSVNHWATTAVDSVNYGKFAAAGYNLGNGLSGVVTGVIAVGSGVLSLPFHGAGEIYGPLAIAGGFARCGLGGARIVRGARQLGELGAQPNVHESPVDQGRD
jgi:hypothetical protein